MPGLSSDIIACAVKLMSNDELIAVGRKVFNPLPGLEDRRAAATWARASSPTRRPTIPRTSSCRSSTAGRTPSATSCSAPTPCRATSIRWPRSRSRCATCCATFELEDVLPHCVLAHIDVQAQVEQKYPGSTALWFQSLAGVADANAVFDIDVEKMRRHAATRTGPFGLYFETGQGADGPTATARASTW